jgi:hypothetical protein
LASQAKLYLAIFGHVLQFSSVQKGEEKQEREWRASVIIYSTGDTQGMLK